MNFDMKYESEQFDKAADYYDMYRPSYPKQVIQLLVERTHLHRQSKVLELGAGSGKATELLKIMDFRSNVLRWGRI